MRLPGRARPAGPDGAGRTDAPGRLDAAGLRAGGDRIPSAPPATADPARLDAALNLLEITVRQRLDGLLQGNHLGLVPGPGTEPGDARGYLPGDDVRRMDWSVTARTTEPHIRQTVADRELETWIVADLSASLDFGTVNCEKRDLVVAASAAIGHLTRGGGNRIGAIVAAGGEPVRIPAQGGRAHLTRMLRVLATTPRAPEGRRGDLTAAITALQRPPRRRGLAVVVSDFLGEVDPGGTPAWEKALRAVGARHELIAVEVSDPRDLQLPAVGLVTLVDPETGRTREVDTTPALRADFAAAAAAHRDQVARALRRAGAARLSLSTDRDWIADVVRFALTRKRGWSGDGAGRDPASRRPAGAAAPAPRSVSAPAAAAGRGGR